MPPFYALMQINCNSAFVETHTQSMKTRELLKELLHRSGIKANDLAARLSQQKVTQSALSRFMNSKTAEPKISSLAPVADFFGISVEAFFDEDVAGQLLDQLARGELIVGSRGQVKQASPIAYSVHEPKPPAWASKKPSPAWPFQSITPDEWKMLSEEHRTMLELQIRGLLSAAEAVKRESINRPAA